MKNILGTYLIGLRIKVLNIRKKCTFYLSTTCYILPLT